MRLKLMLLAVVLSFYGGWKVHSWYEGNKEKEVIEKEVEFFNEQTLKDADKLLIAEIELEKYKEKAYDLEREAYKLSKGICDSTDSYVSFRRLYNKTIKEANKKSTK